MVKYGLVARSLSAISGALMLVGFAPDAKAQSAPDGSAKPAIGSQAVSRNVTECDVLTSDPHDPARVAPPVAKIVDVQKAYRACIEAHKSFPDNSRITFELGRVVQTVDESRAAGYFLEAANKDYGVANYVVAMTARNAMQKMIYLQAAAAANVPSAKEQLATLLEQQKKVASIPPQSAPPQQAHVLAPDDCRPKADEWLPGAKTHAPWETHEFKGCGIDPNKVLIGAAAAVAIGAVIEREATKNMTPEQLAARSKQIEEFEEKRRADDSRLADERSKIYYEMTSGQRRPW